MDLIAGQLGKKCAEDLPFSHYCPELDFHPIDSQPSDLLQIKPLTASCLRV